MNLLLSINRSSPLPCTRGEGLGVRGQRFPLTPNPSPPSTGERGERPRSIGHATSDEPPANAVQSGQRLRRSWLGERAGRRGIARLLATSRDQRREQSAGTQGTP